jgi:vesicle-associated membrane protein 72
MVENIEKLIERGDKIEIVLGNSEDLAASGEVFRNNGRELRRSFTLRQQFLILMLITIVVIIIIVLFWFFYFFLKI